MATVRFGLSPQEHTSKVAQAAGSATVADSVEVTIDVDATGMNKQRAVDSLYYIIDYITAKPWPV